jgi:acetyl-CoA carboxylase carboxyl transferase subunit alpha
MLKMGLIDGIVKEPLGGAHIEPEAMANKIKKVIVDTIEELSKLETSDLIAKRIDKFSSMGVFTEV